MCMMRQICCIRNEEAHELESLRKWGDDKTLGS